MTEAGSVISGRTPCLDELRDEFERASRAAGGPIDRHYTIAGGAVRMRFANGTAATLFRPAFAHLESPPDAAALTLHVWDSVGPVGTMNGTSSGAGASYFYEGADHRALHQPAIDALSVLSADNASAWFGVPDVSALPYWEYASPFRHLLSWWLAARGCLHVHGGAVGTEEGGLLLVGRGGSGKSTTALASLLDKRLRYAGDDYVAVGGDGTRMVYSLYASAKVERADLDRMPHLRAVLANPDRPDEKAVFHVHSAFPDRTTSGFPLRAVVVPRVTERRTARGVAATPADALTALAPSTIFQLHPPAREALSQMAKLVRTVPTFVLELGIDTESVPNELVRLLEETR